MTSKNKKDSVKLPIAYADECYLLGTVIMSEDALSKALAARLNDFDFADTRNKIIWDSITKLVSSNVEVNLQTITSYLDKNDLLKAVPAVYIAKLADTYVYSGDVDRFVKSVRNSSNRRRLNYLAKQVAEMSGNTSVDIKELISAIQNLEEASLEATDETDKISDYLETSFEEELKELAKVNVKTGFKRLDFLFNNRIYPGLYVLGAISSLGKTTFYAQIADQIAQQKIPVLYFSIEQSQLEIVSKSLSRHIRDVHNKSIPSIRIRSNWYPNMDEKASPTYVGKNGDIKNVFEPEDIKYINEAYEWYKREVAPYMQVSGSNFSCTISTIKSKIKAIVTKNRDGQKPVIFIDYLQIVQPEKDFRGTEKQQLDYVMTELERLSKQLQITIFAISSINRISYTQPISFESFKASGSVEYSADVILAMDLNVINTINETTDKTEAHNILDSAKSKIPREIQLKVLKNRYGRTGQSTCFRYYPDADYFENVDSFEHDLVVQQSNPSRNDGSFR